MKKSILVSTNAILLSMVISGTYSTAFAGVPCTNGSCPNPPNTNLCVTGSGECQCFPQNDTCPPDPIPPVDSSAIPGNKK